MRTRIHTRTPIHTCMHAAHASCLLLPASFLDSADTLDNIAKRYTGEDHWCTRQRTIKDPSMYVARIPMTKNPPAEP